MTDAAHDRTHRPETVRLAALAEELIAELPDHRGGHAARTLLAGESLRAVVIALQAGHGLAEHDAPPAATLYCITGRVTLRSGDHEVTLGPGELVPVPPARHAVDAHTDAALLLTVVLR